MEKVLIVSLAVIITLLPLALLSRRLYRWLRRDNLVAELEEETIRLSDLAGGLKEALASAESQRREAEGWSDQAMKENERLGKQNYSLEDRIIELEAASRTDHQTIGDLHQQLARTKRQLAKAKGDLTTMKKRAGIPVKAPARKRGGK